MRKTFRPQFDPVTSFINKNKNFTVFFKIKFDFKSLDLYSSPCQNVALATFIGILPYLFINKLKKNK